MKNHFLIIVFCLFANLAIAQPNLSKEKVAELTALSKKIEGTYQVQVINSREMAAIPLDLVEIVESKRLEKDTSYYWMKDNIRVMILPKILIQNPSFKKIPILLSSPR